jgi:L-alanine-DL-glutamate epimerase-like enolase superfamily enzyme
MTADCICAVEAIALELPLQRPVAFSTRRLQSRSFCLVRLTTQDGIEGVGYSYGGQLIAHAVDLALAHVVLNKPAGAIEQRWQEMYQEALLLGRRGVVLRAISAVDIALWDILAQRANLSLASVLGGNTTTVPCYFSGGYYRDDGRPEDVRDEAARAVDAGFTSMKIKIGRDTRQDIKRATMARDVLGDDRLLALDANNAWQTAAEALPALRGYDELNPWWIEEPLSPDNPEGHATLRTRLKTPIATGEIEATRWGFQSLINTHAADILQPDACVLGGISEWLKVAHLAASAGLPVAPHWNADVHTHLAAATPNCLAVEYFAAEEDVYNFDLVLAEHLTVHQGQIEVPQRPGVGLVLDPEAVAHYTAWSNTQKAEAK